MIFAKSTGKISYEFLTSFSRYIPVSAIPYYNAIIRPK